MSEISIDDIERELTPDIVAARCTEYTFKGRKLHAFSKTRQAAAVTMGTKCFVGGVDRDEGGAYPEMFMDALKVVWLCVVDDTTARRACFQPKTAQALALDWWETQGDDIGSPGFVELMERFGSILEDLTTVSAEVETKGGGGSDSLGE